MKGNYRLVKCEKCNNDWSEPGNILATGMKSSTKCSKCDISGMVVGNVYKDSD